MLKPPSVPTFDRQQSLLNSSIRLHNGRGITSSPQLQSGRRAAKANVRFWIALSLTALGLGLIAYAEGLR